MNIYTFGDSHSDPIEFYKSHHYTLIPTAGINGRGSFHAASAMGLNNPNSVSKSQIKFINDLSEIRKTDISDFKLLLKFGQVDAEFVYYMGVFKNENLSFEEFAHDSINKYFNFLNTYTNINKILICSINPPVLSDGHFKDILPTLHLTNEPFKSSFINWLSTYTSPDLLKRTKYHQLYNYLLLDKCKKFNINFIDSTIDFIDKTTGICKYINDDRDFHLKKSAIIHMNDNIKKSLYINNSNLI